MTSYHYAGSRPTQHANIHYWPEYWINEALFDPQHEQHDFYHPRAFLQYLQSGIFTHKPTGTAFGGPMGVKMAVLQYSRYELVYRDLTNNLRPNYRDLTNNLRPNYRVFRRPDLADWRQVLTACGDFLRTYIGDSAAELERLRACVDRTLLPNPVITQTIRAEKHVPPPFVVSDLDYHEAGDIMRVGGIELVRRKSDQVRSESNQRSVKGENRQARSEVVVMVPRLDAQSDYEDLVDYISEEEPEQGSATNTDEDQMLANELKRQGIEDIDDGSSHGEGSAGKVTLRVPLSELSGLYQLKLNARMSEALPKSVAEYQLDFRRAGADKWNCLEPVPKNVSRACIYACSQCIIRMQSAMPSTTIGSESEDELDYYGGALNELKEMFEKWDRGDMDEAATAYYLTCLPFILQMVADLVANATRGFLITNLVVPSTNDPRIALEGGYAGGLAQGFQSSDAFNNAVAAACSLYENYCGRSALHLMLAVLTPPVEAARPQNPHATLPVIDRTAMYRPFSPRFLETFRQIHCELIGFRDNWEFTFTYYDEGPLSGIDGQGYYGNVNEKTKIHSLPDKPLNDDELYEWMHAPLPAGFCSCEDDSHKHLGPEAINEQIALDAFCDPISGVYYGGPNGVQLITILYARSLLEYMRVLKAEQLAASQPSSSPHGSQNEVPNIDRLKFVYVSLFSIKEHTEAGLGVFRGKLQKSYLVIKASSSSRDISNVQPLTYCVVTPYDDSLRAFIRARCPARKVSSPVEEMDVDDVEEPDDIPPNPSTGESSRQGSVASKRSFNNRNDNETANANVSGSSSDEEEVPRTKKKKTTVIQSEAKETRRQRIVLSPATIAIDDEDDDVIIQEHPFVSSTPAAPRPGPKSVLGSGAVKKEKVSSAMQLKDVKKTRGKAPVAADDINTSSAAPHARQSLRKAVVGSSKDTLVGPGNPPLVEDSFAAPDSGAFASLTQRVTRQAGAQAPVLAPASGSQELGDTGLPPLPQPKKTSGRRK
ncbi:hypothetical protein RhiJN_24430 [Ceratobasidium sp. AG-Ba]|nr:hypothetical protein RhiJN_24430 [Ceratobasidium sp. AG-Ba]